MMMISAFWDNSHYVAMVYLETGMSSNCWSSSLRLIRLWIVGVCHHSDYLSIQLFITCVCSICMHTYVRAKATVHWISFFVIPVIPYLISLRQRLTLNPKLTISIQLGGQWTPRIILHLSNNTGATALRIVYHENHEATYIFSISFLFILFWVFSYSDRTWLKYSLHSKKVYAEGIFYLDRENVGVIALENFCFVSVFFA